VATARANINTVRLDADEIAFKPIPHLGSMERLTTGAVSAVQQVREPRSLHPQPYIPPPTASTSHPQPYTFSA